MTVTPINPGNEALEYIDLRVADPGYRGNHSSQHNRYSMEQISTILTLFNKYAPNRALMHIRTEDLSARPANTPEEAEYARFCDEVKALVGIGTQDAMRKNLFVDLNRMGLLERFGAKKEIKPAGPKASITYVALSEQGEKFVQAKDILSQYFIFSKAIDALLGGVIGVVLNILLDVENGVEFISLDEYQYFISAIGDDSTFGLTQGQAIKLIQSWRNLTPTQRRAVLETHRGELQPDKFGGNKTSKRDFHNWRNEAQQIFHLLNQTVYFEVRSEQLVLKGGRYSFEPEEKRLERSLSEKHRYFTLHSLPGKVSGFELHHAVPLAWSESQQHFKILDKAENMVYIDGFNHARITQNRNRNVMMNFKKEDLILSDFSGNDIYFENKKHIVYDPAKQDVMKKYNHQLLATVQHS